MMMHGQNHIKTALIIHLHIVNFQNSLMELCNTWVTSVTTIRTSYKDVLVKPFLIMWFRWNTTSAHVKLIMNHPTVLQCRI